MKKNRDLRCAVCGKAFHNSHKDRQCCSRQCRTLNMRYKAFSKVEQQFNEPIFVLLYRLYYFDNQGIKAISKLIGVSDRVLWDWFEFLGIPRRNRSDAVALQWVNNDKRRVNASQQASDWYKERPDKAKEFSIRGNAAQQNINGPTSIERRMSQALDGAGVKYVFQFSVGDKFLCDFFIPDANLIIECDGEYWHTKPRQQTRDASKDAYLKACGFTVLRFTDKQINQSIDACVHIILNHLK